MDLLVTELLEFKHLSESWYWLMMIDAKHSDIYMTSVSKDKVQGLEIWPLWSIIGIITWDVLSYFELAWSLWLCKIVIFGFKFFHQINWQLTTFIRNLLASSLIISLLLFPFINNQNHYHNLFFSTFQEWPGSWSSICFVLILGIRNFQKTKINHGC